MIYRNAHKEEYKQLADIHHVAFKEFFLTGLGLVFLQTYYRVVLASGMSIAVCAVDDNNKMLGFCSGSKTKGGYHSKILAYGWLLFGFQAVKLIFTRPASLLRLAKNLNKRPHPSDTGDYSELLAIAVLPETKGLGVGKSLLSAYEKEAMKAGFSRIALTTDFHNNDNVVAFYQKAGYEILYDFQTYPGRHMYKMIKTL